MSCFFELEVDVFIPGLRITVAKNYGCVNDILIVFKRKLCCFSLFQKNYFTK